MAQTFIRARSQSQKEERREQILSAAERAVNELGMDQVTLQHIAKDVGIAKSAFYRYFKSKEEIFAYLLIMQADEITEEFRDGLAECKDLNAFVALFAAICAKRPLFCTLLCDLARTLERNIALEQLIPIKREFGRVLGNWITLLTASHLNIDGPKAIKFVRTAYVVMAGLWPITQNRPMTLQAAKEAGLEETFGEFEVELKTLLRVYVKGLC